MKMKSLFLPMTLFLALAGLASAQHSHAQAGSQTPKGKGQEGATDPHADHHKGVNERGDKVMGFDHTKTTHHFLLFADGGVIQVTANEKEDEASRDQIRSHLRHIAQMFAAGNFTAPMLVHAQTPPGVPEMKRLKEAISYQYEQIEGGAHIRISTKDTEALAAIHQFLRFQISDHQTKDSGVIEKLPH